MRVASRILIIFLVVLGLAACPATKKTTADDDVSTSGTGDEGLTQADLLARKRVHFAYDSAEIEEGSRRIIEAHAEHLANNPRIKVRLEGHADERGTREYNLALGERRAKAVKRVMSVLGVKASRIKVVSYGEEKPLDEGHDSTAWRKNRRVEIIY